PDRLKTCGVDSTTGSLGQGISIAGGMALSHKLAGRKNRVFCIVGDGELTEGQCWEARVARSPSDEVNEYEEEVERVVGIYAPHLGAR
ncbi:hypothetical protein O5269_27160, partial [Escherichia coli]|nr:hypothetical protein [Escherichia coli]